MAQFDLYAHPNTSTEEAYPFLLDVQAELLDGLDTRLVIPVTLCSRFADKQITHLTPIFTINKSDFLLLTPQMAAIHKRALGPSIGNYASLRSEIIASIDFFITGF